MRPTHTNLNLPPLKSLMLWQAAHTCRNLVSPLDACRAVNTPSSTELDVTAWDDGLAVAADRDPLGVAPACDELGDGGVACCGPTEPHPIKPRRQTIKTTHHGGEHLGGEHLGASGRPMRRTFTTTEVAMRPTPQESFHRFAPRCTEPPRAGRSSCRIDRQRVDRWSPSAHRSACPPHADAAPRPSPRP